MYRPIYLAFLAIAADYDKLNELNDEVIGAALEHLVAEPDQEEINIPFDEDILGAKPPPGITHVDQAEPQPTPFPTWDPCEPDYEGRNCPANWIPTVSNCVPPSDYQGGCASLPIEYPSTEAKAAAADRCAAHWPCRQGVIDPLVCPDDWEVVDSWGVLCRPTDAYAGPCRFEQQFASFTDGEKEVWGRR